MKRYYIQYIADFANTYNLFYTDEKHGEDKLPEGSERITRAQAIAKCRAEIERRKYDQMFSGFAAAEIYPAGYDKDPRNDKHMTLVGHIWEEDI